MIKKTSTPPPTKKNYTNQLAVNQVQHSDKIINSILQSVLVGGRNYKS